MKVMASPAFAGFVPVVMAMLTAGTTLEVTETVMVLLVAVLVVAHETLLVNTHCTVCPLVSVVLENVALLLPAFAPFTNH